jgi:hypothetical protein
VIVEGSINVFDAFVVMANGGIAVDCDGVWYKNIDGKLHKSEYEGKSWQICDEFYFGLINEPWGYVEPK